jgi:hypothetical protein
VEKKAEEETEHPYGAWVKPVDDPYGDREKKESPSGVKPSN